MAVKRINMPAWGWKLILILVGFGLGTAYYYNMSLSIPKDSNCSFSANIWTDILAFVFGVVIMAIGFRLQRWEGYVLVALGTAIIVEHIWQLVHNKMPKKKKSPRRLSRVAPSANAPDNPDAERKIRLLHPGGFDTQFVKLKTSGLTVAYETFGSISNQAVLLLHGLGADMTTWPEEEFIEPLVQRGFYVIRMDSRDAGQSDYISTKGTFTPAQLVRRHYEKLFGIATVDVEVPYTLSDLAQDCVDLLDALGVESAIFAGHSMGGMVAQTVALHHPMRVDGLASIASCTGPAVGPHLPNLYDLIRIYLCERTYLGSNPNKLTEPVIRRIVEGKTRYYHLILGKFTNNWNWHWRKMRSASDA